MSDNNFINVLTGEGDNVISIPYIDENESKQECHVLFLTYMNSVIGQVRFYCTEALKEFLHDYEKMTFGKRWGYITY